MEIDTGLSPFPTKGIEKELKALGVEVVDEAHVRLPTGWRTNMSRHMGSPYYMYNATRAEVARWTGTCHCCRAEVGLDKDDVDQFIVHPVPLTVEMKRKRKLQINENNTNKRRKADEKDEKEVADTKMSLVEANDVAGLVPNAITTLMQRGHTHSEALVRLLEHWPDSENVCRQFEKHLSETALHLNAAQQTDTKTKLEADRTCNYERFYEIAISAPGFNHHQYFFQSVQQACQALIDVLKQFPEQKVKVVSDDLAKGKSKWDMQLSALIRKLELTIEKKRTKMIQVEELYLVDMADMAPERLWGQGHVFRIWVTERQFSSKCEFTKNIYDPSG